MTICYRVAVWMFLAIVLWQTQAWAHPRMPEAHQAAKAGVVIMGQVEDAWFRNGLMADYETGDRMGYHRIIRVRVLEVWKGDVKAGDEVLVVDTRPGFGYGDSDMDERQPTLLYLSSVDKISGALHTLPNYDARWARNRAFYDDPEGQPTLEWSRQVRYRGDKEVPPSENPFPRIGDRPLYGFVRMMSSDQDGDGWRDDPKLKDELEFLDALFSAPLDDDPLAHWRSVLETEVNADLLLYALGELPLKDDSWRDLSLTRDEQLVRSHTFMPEDRERLIALLARLPLGNRAIDTVIRLLRYGKVELPPEISARFRD